ncbi:AprI/Inh family metalloprotease inhibitor [Jiella sp. M17.18]|uniref:AprI/Inh family metalloprotease inhibitor n=1 Tax=Jiella sp. M17.18 TaxID=3234247 RepID=UPI0034E017CF
MTHVLKTGAAVVALLVAAGCSRTVSPYESGGPAPLAPAPAGNVAASQLPPPPPPPPPQSSTINAVPQDQTMADAGAATGTENAGSDMTGTGGAGAGNGGSGQTKGGGTQVASLGGSSQPLSRTAVSGFYKLSAQGGSCQIGLAYTKWAGGYRAASRGCPGQIADVTAWDVSGNQIVLKDSGGATIASLSSVGGSKYSGQTSGGQSITIYR